MPSTTPGNYRLDIWTVGRTVLQLHLDASCKLDATSVLSITTTACAAGRPGQVLYLYEAAPPARRPLGRTGDRLVWYFAPGMECLLGAIGRLVTALEGQDEPSGCAVSLSAPPASRRRRKRSAAPVALGGAA